MIHHDNRNYQEAASSAAKHGRDKMNEVIERGRASAGKVVEDVLSRVINDRIVKTRHIKMERADDGAWHIRVPRPSGDFDFPRLHNHAFNQMTEDAGVPKRYVDELLTQANGTQWGKDLVEHNFNTIFAHRDEQRNLIRSEGGEVKGWLSDKFRRIDSRPLLDSFLGAAQELGLIPISGFSLDTKVRLRTVLPRVFEPVKDEVMCFGLEWGNSDYGAGGHVVNVWMMRVYCTNLAIADEMLRQVHLGKRLPEDLRFSEETYKKDTDANISALKDVVHAAIGPARVNAMLQVIKDTAEKEVNGKDVAKLLTAKKLDKASIDRAVALFESPDVLNLPAGNTQWRLSNVISFLANHDGIAAERKLELQELAGDLIPHKKVQAKEV